MPLPLLFLILFYAFVIIVKIWWGYSDHNLSLLTDGIDSLKNLITMGTAFFFFQLSQQSSDPTHHWGHKKYDAFGALLISIFQIFISGITGTYILLNFSTKPTSTALPHAVWSSVLMALIIIALWLISQRYQSTTLIAEFKHELIDFLQTLFVTITTYFSLNYSFWLNGVVALFITLLLFANGIFGIMKTERYLVDRSPPRKMFQSIRKLIRQECQPYAHLRDLKVALSTRNTLRLELTLQMDGNLTLKAAHTKVHQLESQILHLLEENGYKIEHISIHFEPKGAHALS